MFLCVNLHNIGYVLFKNFISYSSRFWSQTFGVKSSYSFTTKAICMGLKAAVTPKYALSFRPPDCSTCFLVGRHFAPLSARRTLTHLLRCRSYITLSTHLFLGSPRGIVHGFLWGSSAPCGFQSQFQQ